MHSSHDPMILPRKRPNGEIKLLRLELVPKPQSPCDIIGNDWIHAQPAENLSPQKAAESLGVEPWDPQSTIQKRYRTLQIRYPSDQFMEKHSQWRPSTDLLENPTKRLNWYWQSGFIPNPQSQRPKTDSSLWDIENTEPLFDGALVLERIHQQHEEELPSQLR